MNKILVLIFASTFSLTACGGFLGSKTIADNTETPNKDYDTVNGSIKVGYNANVGDLSTVNGSVKVASGSKIGSAETVNGSIVFEDEVSAESAETVNGSIKLGSSCLIVDDVETVNGSITANSKCNIGGNFQTVNGKLLATDTEIQGNVETVNGKVYLLDGTIVHDDIIIKKSKGFFNKNKKKPVVVIGQYVIVKGDLEFGREVDLYIHETADVEEDIENAKIIRFSGDEKPYK
ncbi:MAG: hypothetical protein AB8B80_16135 [Marinicellaceae bacterium]